MPPPAPLRSRHGPAHPVRTALWLSFVCFLILKISPLLPFTAGKYLVTPLSRASEDGQHFTASVSIRSGQGRGTHDRIYTFRRAFGSSQAALRHALAQGRHWLDNSRTFA